MKELKDRKPGIVFDFGGVLIDWNPRYLYRGLFNDDTEAMERFLDEVEFVAWNQQQDKGRPFAIAVAELCRQFPHYGDMIRAYHQRWRESIAGVIQPSVDILYRLKEAGHTLFGLSNWAAETFYEIRDSHQFLEVFDDIVISGDVGLIKPDPLIFDFFLKRVRRDAKSCLFIDDSQANIDAARDLGFQTILFESPGQLEAELDRLDLFRQSKDSAA
jgi:2-haloacid dehalogenase